MYQVRISANSTTVTSLFRLTPLPNLLRVDGSTLHSCGTLLGNRLHRLSKATVWTSSRSSINSSRDWMIIRHFSGHWYHCMTRYYNAFCFFQLHVSDIPSLHAQFWTIIVCPFCFSTSATFSHVSVSQHHWRFCSVRRSYSEPRPSTNAWAKQFPEMLQLLNTVNPYSISFGEDS